MGLEKAAAGFVQMQGICSVSDTLFTTDAAAEKIKPTPEGFVRNNRLV